MTDVQQAKFEGWAIVDVLGHQRYVGFVTTEAYGQAVLFRVDVPALEPRERVTKQPGYVGDRYVPAGTTVKEGAVAGYTKLIGSGSIYSISPCTQETALAAVERTQPRPLMALQLPAAGELSAATDGDEDGRPSLIPDDDDREPDDGDSDDEVDVDEHRL